MTDYKIITIDGFDYLVDLKADMLNKDYYITLDNSIYSVGNRIKDIDSTYVINADDIRYYRSDKEEGNALHQLSDAIERAMDSYVNMTAPAGGYSYEDLRYHCTRFAHLCRLKGPKINHETVDLFDQEYAPLLTQKEQYVNIATRTVMSEGWVPTYNNPDNHNLDPSAEPISVPLISYDNNNKPYITII